MTLDELRKAVDDGTVDTVLLAFADMQGRLQGKRLVGDHFLDEVVEHGAEACNYLLAVDVEMNTVDGYAMSSWETGYGDFEMKPDFATLRPVPWHAGTAMCMADLQWHDGVAGRRLAAPDPARASSTGSPSAAGTRWRRPSSSSSCSATPTRRRGTSATTASSRATSTTSTTRCSAPRGSSRCSAASGARWPAPDLPVENSKGECNFGQHEINFRYEDALSAADIAHDLQERRQGDRRPGGHVDHLHGQVRRARGQLVPHPPVRCATDDGTPVFADDSRELFERFLAGQLACLRELTLFLAPNINSYKRFAGGLVRADRGRLGPRQPHVLDARDRPRAVAADREPRRRAATSTRTWRSRR